MRLAAGAVAKDKKEAFFKAVYVNETPPTQQGETPVLGLVNMIYKGAQTVPAGGKSVEASVVEVRAGTLGKERTETLYLDSAGRVVLITKPDDESLLHVTLVELLQKFPEAKGAMESTAAQAAFDLNRLYPRPRPPGGKHPSRQVEEDP